MKKIILLVIILLLTGCNVKCDISINADTIQESINIMAENEEENQKIVDEKRIPYAYIDDLEENPPTYQINKNLNNNLYEMQLSYNFPFNRYIEATMANSYINGFNILPSNNNYSFSTNIVNAFVDNINLNNLIINIMISDEFNILDTNADSVNNNIMVWNINRDNYLNKQIIFKLENIKQPIIINHEEEETQEIITVKENNNNKSDFIKGFTILVIFILSLIVLLFIKKEYK